MEASRAGDREFGPKSSQINNLKKKLGFPLLNLVLSINRIRQGMVHSVSGDYIILMLS